MIIISQDKDIIINFDNIKSVWIDDNVLDKTDCDFEIVAGEETVGSYRTKERAKEVLQEITKKYSSYLELKGGRAITPEGMNVQPNIFNVPKVYEMPQE